MRTDPQYRAGLDVPEAAAKHEPERTPFLLAQYPARIYAAGNAQGRPRRGAAVRARGASGQLLAALGPMGSTAIPGEGYAMARPGSVAGYFGPCAAWSEETARELVKWFLGRYAQQRVYWDLLPDNVEAARLARARASISAAAKISGCSRNASTCSSI